MQRVIRSLTVVAMAMAGAAGAQSGGQAEPPAGSVEKKVPPPAVRLPTQIPDGPDAPNVRGDRQMAKPPSGKPAKPPSSSLEQGAGMRTPTGESPGVKVGKDGGS